MAGDFWQAVSTVVTEANRARVAPLSEQELLDAALEFANKGSARAWLALLSGIKVPADLFSSPRVAAIADRVVAEEFEPARQRLVDDMAAVVRGADTSAIARRAAREAARVVLVPHFELVDGALRVTHRYLAQDLAARVSYVVLLLLDSSRDFGRRLCQCKLETCERFFWERRSTQGGRRGRSFCSPEHMREHNSATAAERVRRHREKQRNAKRAPRRTRR